MPIFFEAVEETNSGLTIVPILYKMKSQALSSLPSLPVAFFLLPRREAFFNNYNYTRPSYLSLPVVSVPF